MIVAVTGPTGELGRAFLRALEGGEAGDLLLVFPTIKNLERLARFDTADALLEWAAQHEVRPVQPRVEGQGEAARIVLEDDDD